MWWVARRLLSSPGIPSNRCGSRNAAARLNRRRLRTTSTRSKHGSSTPKTTRGSRRCLGRWAVSWRRNGPVTGRRNATLPASFTVTLANGRAASGSFGVFLNDPVSVSNRRAVNGALDGSGRILLQVPTNVQPGVYQLLFSYGGETAQITTVAVR